MGLLGTWSVTFTVMTGVSAQETWAVEEVDGEVRLHGRSPEGETTEAVVAVDGDAFSFEVPVPGMPMRATISGQVDGDRITGAARLTAMQFGTFDGSRTT